MDDQLLKPADVADILNISRAMAYTMLRQGTIPVVRIGSMVRVRQSDLDEFIREMKQNDPNTLPKA